MKDYYLILGIEPSATQEEVRIAYRNRAKKYHPDKNEGDKYFEERFKDIQEAFSHLTDINKRMKYDYDFARNIKSKFSAKDYTTHDDVEKIIRELKKIHEVKEINYEQKIDQYKKEFDAILKDKEHITIGLYFSIIVLFFLSLYTYSVVQTPNDNVKQSQGPDLNQGNLDKISLLENLLQNKDREIEELKNNSQNQLDKLSKFQELEKKKIKKNAIESLTLNESSNSTGKSLGFNSFLKNNRDVDITKVNWGDYDYPRGEKIIEKLSIKNNTSHPIKQILITYEVFDANGQAINSGKFYVLNQSYEILPPLQAKEFYITGLQGPHKISSEKLVLNIDHYMVKEEESSSY